MKPALNKGRKQASDSTRQNGHARLFGAPRSAFRPYASPPLDLIDLHGQWQLHGQNEAAEPIACPIAIPGDVHSALLDAQLIPDPYFGANEDAVQWVAHRPWTIRRSFSAHPRNGFWVLTLDEVDCLADVFLNGAHLGRLENQFRRHRFEVGQHLIEGENVLELRFDDAHAQAQRRFDAHPFELPYTMGRDRRVPINLLRKTQCSGGWDWNICLMPLGLYGEASLRRVDCALIEHVQVHQHHRERDVKVTFEVEIRAYASATLPLSVQFNETCVRLSVNVTPGLQRYPVHFTVHGPKLWWPAGQGEQHLYPATIRLGEQVEQRRIGLRTIELVTAPDAIGTTMKFRVNGRDIFAKGANWIPADALPRRITPQAVVPVLASAVAANMNMLRVWGGGNYEKEWFYDACDELGLLVWQDFMFSCMLYPSDRAYLTEVRLEAEYQVKRLQHRACVALWCGDNELVGAIEWYEASRANRDRYLVNYDRLNRVLEDAAETFDAARPFWNSSPSLGKLDYADGWHCDTRGDMHFWEVWHSAKPFEHYRTVQPRFCSEFGFQSFPSLDCVHGFTGPADRNVSSPVMEVHQRNDGGNARILETMTRNFRFPKDFDQMILLSQIQQGLAIKMAVDAWRSSKPRCMGTLYWQLNDTWPVASWSSLEYGGRWKVLHYLARRFYAPVNVIALPEDGAVRLVAVSDAPDALELQVQAVAVGMDGRERRLWSGAVQLTHEAARELATLPVRELAADEFIQLRWQDAGGAHAGTDDFLPRYHKEYDLPRSAPRVHWVREGDTLDALVETDAPCFFTVLETSAPGYFSDNAFTLLPGQPRRVRWHGGPLDTSGVRIRHLADTH
ncbi:MAG: beta-mannosidase [Gammaproteobacteria bacterium]